MTYLLLFIYIASGVINYYCFRWLYNHVLKHVRPGLGDMFIVLCPFVNTIGIIPLLVVVSEEYTKMHNRNRQSIFDKFFGIRRRK
jgi:hypothetical protein